MAPAPPGRGEALPLELIHLHQRLEAHPRHQRELRARTTRRCVWGESASLKFRHGPHNRGFVSSISFSEVGQESRMVKMRVIDIYSHHTSQFGMYLVFLFVFFHCDI